MLLCAVEIIRREVAARTRRDAKAKAKRRRPKGRPGAGT